ncbi:antirestriction protein ArdA [Nonomuraea sp. SYSU D8015]|uniref:antirestriction protein ArdA n=1 Tax=Nonomuraea sp. SYSU D8015 TaxID=2593644 RepID=UPI0016601D7F|nr:antirestriction protein ArdA [Nonomuraea sp. SYSU D8015]
MPFDNPSLLVTFVGEGEHRHEELEFDLLDVELAELQDEIRKAIGPCYTIETDDDDWEGVAVAEAASAHDLWQLARTAHKLDYSEAFLAWVAHVRPYSIRSLNLEEAVEDFGKEFVGAFENFEAYGRDSLADEILRFPALDTFFDFEGYGEWLASDYTSVDLNAGGFALFRKV